MHQGTNQSSPQVKNEPFRSPRPFGDFDLRPSDPNQAQRLSKISWWILGIGLGLTIALAILGSSESAAISAILALLSGLLQVASVLIGQWIGRPDPNLVRHLSRRTQVLGRRMNLAVESAEVLFKASEGNDEVRSAVGRLSVELDYTREALGELLETWRDLNPELFKDRGDEHESN
ncbi:MAG: hypothetical protein ACRDS0_08985 [Pseudonocardiaceae bacterium]